MGLGLNKFRLDEEIKAIAPVGGSGSPSGAAGGALTGTYPNPNLAAGVATGSALGADVITTSTHAGGSISGVYSALALVDGSVTSSKLANGAATGAVLGSDVAKLVGGLVPTSVLGTGAASSSNFLRGDGTWSATTGGPPTGAAGGSLAGAYPNPTLANGVATGAVLGADVVVTSQANVANGYVKPNASNLISLGQMGAGTPSSTTYLRGDGTWAAGTAGPLSGLSDTSITGLADGNMLLYHAGAGKWQNDELPWRTFEFFGGAVGGTLTNQTSAWTAARAWLVTNGGGTIFFGPGVYTHMPAMDLPPFTTLMGCGFMVTELHADSGIANHFIQTHKSTSGTTSDPNGVGCTIRDLALNCFDMTGWGVSANDAIHFDRNPTFGTDPTIGSGSIVEPNQSVINVLVRNPPRDGINAAAMGGHFYQNVRMIGCGRYGFLPTFDSWLINCSSASSLNHGFHIQVGPSRLVECVSYNSGNSAANHNQGHGFYIDGTNGIADSVTLVECEAQDNFGVGFYVNQCPFATVGLIGCLADSNSSGLVGAHAGFTLLNSPYTRMSGCRAVERMADGTHSFQQNALFIQQSGFSTIDLTHKAQDSGLGAATIGSPISSADGTASPGCDVNINGLRGPQFPSFAASFTPDFYLGGTVEMVLTANVTINAPTNGPWIAGTKATFILQQDATGGRTITWNAAYKNTPTSVTTANGYTVGRFMYDGANWIGI